MITWVYNFSFSATNGPLSCESAQIAVDAIFLIMCLIGIVPAEIFDTRTRSKGVSIGCMVSYAFNTMIGQVTPIAIDRIGYKYYFLFIVCNFTNALFFCKLQQLLMKNTRF